MPKVLLPGKRIAEEWASSLIPGKELAKKYRCSYRSVSDFIRQYIPLEIKKRAFRRRLKEAASKRGLNFSARGVALDWLNSTISISDLADKYDGSMSAIRYCLKQNLSRHALKEGFEKRRKRMAKKFNLPELEIAKEWRSTLRTTASFAREYDCSRSLIASIIRKHLAKDIRVRCFRERQRMRYGGKRNPWLGKRHRRSSRLKISRARKGKRMTLMQRMRHSALRQGVTLSEWKDFTTPGNQRERGSIEYRRWRSAVFVRDFYTCQICGRRGGNLNAHHIKEFSKHPSLRYAVDNGITLCHKHHVRIRGRESDLILFFERILLRTACCQHSEDCLFKVFGICNCGLLLRLRQVQRWRKDIEVKYPTFKADLKMHLSTIEKLRRRHG